MASTRPVGAEWLSEKNFPQKDENPPEISAIEVPNAPEVKKPPEISAIETSVRVYESFQPF